MRVIHAPEDAYKRTVKISQLIEGGVAEASRLLQEGDILCAVNGTRVQDLSFDEIREMIGGPVGSPICFAISHTIAGHEHFVVLVRAGQERTCEKEKTKSVCEKVVVLHQTLEEALEREADVVTELQVRLACFLSSVYFAAEKRECF